MDTKDDINRIESFVREDENSDGVSVISECDNNNDKSQLNNISNIVHPVEKNNAPVINNLFVYLFIIIIIIIKILFVKKNDKNKNDECVFKGM